MVRAARGRKALHREATFRLDDGESGGKAASAGKEVELNEAIALPHGTEEHPDDAELDTTTLADKIMAAAERGDTKALEELGAMARRKVDVMDAE